MLQLITKTFDQSNLWAHCEREKTQCETDNSQKKRMRKEKEKGDEGGRGLHMSNAVKNSSA